MTRNDRRTRTLPSRRTTVRIRSPRRPIRSSRKREWRYGTITEGNRTTITEPNGAVTVEEFNQLGLPTSVTQPTAHLWRRPPPMNIMRLDELIAVTDPDKHKTEYTYDAAGNRRSEKDANGNETKWTYDTTHDVISMTTPEGETTTIKRDSHGNAETIERPAPASKTQKTKYKYDGNGDLESITDPLEHT